MTLRRPGDDARRLADTDLPTPFSADEIRDATPDGHTVETVTTTTTTDDAVTSRRRTTFLDGDEAGVTMRLDTFDADGNAAGEPMTFRTAWVDLQSHASFPVAAAERSWETIETPLGELECLRYDTEAMTCWFAVEHPGMPVVMTAAADEVITTTTVVSIDDG